MQVVPIAAHQGFRPIGASCACARQTEAKILFNASHHSSRTHQEVEFDQPGRLQAR
jgi:hypothetical protein